MWYTQGVKCAPYVVYSRVYSLVHLGTYPGGIAWYTSVHTRVVYSRHTSHTRVVYSRHTSHNPGGIAWYTSLYTRVV